MILLKKIALNNFLSHEETAIEFGPTDQMLLDGASGAGKSSIFDAILWALYGQGRVDNRALVRKGAKKAIVTLELTLVHDQTATKEEITIERSTTSAGKHALVVSVDGVAHALTGVRELQAWIDKDLIGASYLLFVNSAAYVQGNTESFVSQPAPKRKELLLEIVKADDYGKYYEKARAALTTLAGDEQKALGQVTELEAQLGALQSRLGGKTDLIATIGTESARIKDIVPKREALEAQKARYTALSSTVGVLDGVLKKAVSDKEIAESVLATKLFKIKGKPELEQQLQGQSAVRTQIDETKGKLAAARIDLTMQTEHESTRNAYAARKPIVVDRTVEVKRYEDQIDFLKKKPTCPAGDTCPYHSKNKEDIDYNVAEAAKLIALTVKENVALAGWAVEGATIPPAGDLRAIVREISAMEEVLRSKEGELSRLSGLEKDLVMLASIEAEIPGLEKDLADRVFHIGEVTTQKQEAEKAINIEETNRIANELAHAYSEEKEANERITRATAALETIDREEKEAKTIEARVASIRGIEIVGIQDKARKVALVKDAFGSKGIETLVIDYLLPKLEDRINDVLAKLSDFRVRLDTQKKSADGESTIEGLFITILNELGEEMPYESYSGGEKLKISVSISEALATLQKVGFRLFDETFLGLDENSTESFADVLVSLQQRFGQVLCVSHLLQIKDLFDKKVVVSKNNGISHVTA